MLFYKILFFFNFINFTNCFNLCIVSAYNEIGRELVYQAIEENLKVLALTSNSELLIPSKDDILNKNKDLALLNYWEHIDLPYENIIFCTNIKPFEKDYSDKLIEKFLCHLPKECKSIHLVTSKNENLGIIKNKQEKLINNCNKDVEKFIYRPKYFYYGNTLLETTERKKIAQEIIENLYFPNLV